MAEGSPSARRRSSSLVSGAMALSRLLTAPLNYLSGDPTNWLQPHTNSFWITG